MNLLLARLLPRHWSVDGEVSGMQKGKYDHADTPRGFLIASQGGERELTTATEDDVTRSKEIAARVA